MIICNAEFCTQQFQISEENGKLKLNVLVKNKPSQHFCQARLSLIICLLLSMQLEE